MAIRSSKRSTTDENVECCRPADDPDLPAAATQEVPPLEQHPARKVSLLVEPTPFTHVSGYSNRFKEMLRFLKDGALLTLSRTSP